MSVVRIFLIGMVIASSIFGAASSQGAILITEVHSAGSGNANGYSADWFELTNNGNAAVDITGWKFDDNSDSSAVAVLLNGVTSIAAGQSVVFIEGNATTAANFITAWFGANAPSGFTIGTYSGSGIGLGTGGDAVNIFDASNTLQSRVSLGAATPLATFDNTAGINNGILSTLSVVGVNGAFTSFGGASEVGSPGVSAVPEPGSLLLLATAVAGGIIRFRRTKNRSN